MVHCDLLWSHCCSNPQLFAAVAAAPAAPAAAAAAAAAQVNKWKCLVLHHYYSNPSLGPGFGVHDGFPAAAGPAGAGPAAASVAGAAACSAAAEGLGP